MIEQNRYKFIVIILLLLLHYPAFGQSYDSKPRQSPLNSIFISSGQYQTIYLRENAPVRINTIFYPQLTYRIEIFTEDPHYDIEMKLISPDGKKYFTNSDKNYVKFWHFCFQSISSSIIELSARNKNIKEQQVHIIISYLQQ